MLYPIPKSTQPSMLPNNFQRYAGTSARCALQNHSEIKSSPDRPSAAGEKQRDMKRESSSCVRCWWGFQILRVKVYPQNCSSSCVSGNIVTSARQRGHTPPEIWFRQSHRKIEGNLGITGIALRFPCRSNSIRARLFFFCRRQLHR